jgi:tRNA 2-thiouridine synthesizing protein E
MSEHTQSITIGFQRFATDNEGYLLNPGDWSMEVAHHIAADEQLVMSEDHWTVVRIVREYFETNQSVPEARRVLKALADQLGNDKATRRYLYSLFPYGYGQQACKIAGMRKPLKLMLDV